jgi:hypothetical protein
MAYRYALYGAERVRNNKNFSTANGRHKTALPTVKYYYSDSFLQYKILHVIILFKYFIVQIFLILEVSQVTCD